MVIKKISFIFVLLLFSLSSFCQNTAELKIIDTAGCNLAIDKKLSDTEYSLVSTSKAPNWFSTVFTDVDTTQKLTFSLCMNGIGDVSKWVGLWPVYTYGKYYEYDTYIYYTKNADGYWVSSDPFLAGAAKLAGNDKTPVQKVIPAEFAEEFLSADGNYWSAWSEIEDTHADSVSNTFFMTKQFNSPNVSIAMKYPYIYDYEEEYMKRLKDADIKGITVHNIGKSIRRHNLYIVEICDPDATEEELKERRVVLMYANEDGDEPDSCRVVNGAMNFLMSGSYEAKKVLKEVTFLFIPMLDPVGWEECTYGKISKNFKPDDYDVAVRTEILSYATFINSWAGQGYNLDVIINLHNIECNEGSNLFSPLINIIHADDIFSANDFIFTRFLNIETSMLYWDIGYVKNRFYGWCSNLWGGLTLLYEINSRYPQNRLNIEDIDDIGKEFTFVFNDYFKTESFEHVFPIIAYQQTKQLNEYTNFYDMKKNIPEHMKIYYTLRKGF